MFVCLRNSFLIFSCLAGCFFLFILSDNNTPPEWGKNLVKELSPKEALHKIPYIGIKY